MISQSTAFTTVILTEAVPLSSSQPWEWGSGSLHYQLDTVHLASGKNQPVREIYSSALLEVESLILLVDPSNVSIFGVHADRALCLHGARKRTFGLTNMTDSGCYEQ